MTNPVVYHNTQQCQYELRVKGLTAIATYKREGNRVILNHTKVPPALEGQGVGGKLIAGALEDIRTRGLRCVAQCRFVAVYIKRHPEYQHLLASV